MADGDSEQPAVREPALYSNIGQSLQAGVISSTPCSQHREQQAAQNSPEPNIPAQWKLLGPHSAQALCRSAKNRSWWRPPTARQRPWPGAPARMCSRLPRVAGYSGLQLSARPQETPQVSLTAHDGSQAGLVARECDHPQSPLQETEG